VEHRELPLYEHVNNSLPSKHPGAKNIRSLLGSFEVVGPHGKHIVLALQASQMSLRDLDTVFMRSRGFDEGFVKGAITELLQALDFLHTEVQAIHTGILPLPFTRRRQLASASSISAELSERFRCPPR
jgi:serine/threonine-protein kinase SRPK3